MCFSVILVRKILQFWGKWVFPCNMSEGPIGERVSTTMAKKKLEMKTD